VAPVLRHLAAGFLLLGFLASCGEEGPAPLARIGNQPLTEEGFRSALPFFGHELGPRDIDTREELLAALDDIAAASALARDSIRRGLHESPAFRAQMAFFKDAELKRAFEDSLLKRFPVKESEIEDYYREHEDEYQVPTRIRLRHIFFDATKAKTEAERARIRRRAEEAREDISSGRRDFIEVAAAESNIGAASAGEILGPIFLHTLVDPIQKALEGLKPGEISEIIETPHGFEILRLEEWDAAHVQSLEKSSDTIRSALERERLGTVYDEIISAYVAEKPFEYRAELLDDPNAPADTVVADNGEITVTLAQFQKWVDTARRSPGWEEGDSTREELLERMVEGEVLRREALRRGVNLTPGFQRRTLWYATKRLADQYARDEAARRVGEPSVEELREHYEKYRDVFATQPETELRAIYIKAEPQDPESVASRGIARREALEKAKAVYEQAMAGADFAELAKSYSASPEAEGGGLLPLAPKGPRGYVIDTTADELEVGGISEPVKFKEGYLVIKKTGERPGEEQPFEEVREQVKKHYMSVHGKEKEAEVRQEALDEVGVTLNESVAERLLREEGDRPSF
jgi:parvulin-like peptidyl-prolyl isomerase